MNEITDLADAQRIDDRMRAPSPRRTACTANRCNGGDKRCPRPDACELPEDSLAGRVWGFFDRVPVRHFWIGYAAFILGCAAGLHLIFN